MTAPEIKTHYHSHSTCVSVSDGSDGHSPGTWAWHAAYQHAKGGPRYYASRGGFASRDAALAAAEAAK
ncbi:MAG: hypothetical protein ACRC4O_09580 [Giesbergeria sp.]